MVESGEIASVAGGQGFGGKGEEEKRKLMGTL
jgi:hypothetical protein